ncbi:MAG: hypothetical protein OHK0041_18530 [Anaerolineales bacterium]
MGIHVASKCEMNLTPPRKVTYKDEPRHICPQCLPLLIHKIHLLADKLPGVDIAPPAAH